MRTLVAAAGALLVYLVWKSLSWQMTGDAPLYHYIAWLISEGLVPYRDIFDFNMPGVFLVHLAVLAIGGDGDLAWRLFDLGALAAIGALLYLFCRPLAGRWGAAAAAALFGLYHLAGGHWVAGQRDFLICGLVLAAMLAICRFVEAPERRRWLVAAGLALGVGVTIKPFAVLIWLGCAAAAGLLAPGPLGRRWPATAVVLAAGAAPPALIVVWLAATGAFKPFLEILLDYTLPFYGRLGIGPLGVWRDSGPSVDGWPFALFFAFLGLLGWSARVAPRQAQRRWLTLLGVAYGVAHFVLQGKGYGYHYYPLICFLLALAAPALRAATQEEKAERRGERAAPGSRLAAVTSISRRQVAALTFAAALVAIGVGGTTGRSAFDFADTYGERGRALLGDLSRLVPPGESVQVLDDTYANATLALLRLRIRQPTPFITDTPLFVDTEDPRIRRLQERFVADLVSARPAAIVVSKHNMVRRSFDRVWELPGLGSFLLENYRVAVNHPRAYQLWLREDLGERGRPRAPAPGAR